MRQGRIRHHHFGEGEYDESEHVIQQLLAEAGNKDVAKGVVQITAAGAEAAADEGNVKSPETYVGFMRVGSFLVARRRRAGRRSCLRAAGGCCSSISGRSAARWTIEDEKAILGAAGGSIAFRFHARDLHLVLGTGDDGKPVRFRVLIDGQPPGDDHGVDIDASGTGTVTDQRLYQLVRQHGAVKDQTFEIQFLDPGVQAFAFTFG